MEDIQRIITGHLPKHQLDKSDPEKTPKPKIASVSEIPDLFFDDILIKHKLSRIEIVVLMHVYRLVWCRPNLHRDYGISPVVSYSDVAENLDIEIDELQASLRKLENFEFLETVRAGQFFVRKYFTKENDQIYGQRYDDFL